MVGQDAGQVVAVGAQLEQLADGQPRAVAERLAVHHERILLDPLDRHALSRPCRGTAGTRSSCARRRPGVDASGTARSPRRSPRPRLRSSRVRAARERRAKPLAQADEVVERDALAAIDRATSSRRTRGRRVGSSAATETATRSASSSASRSRARRPTSSLRSRSAGPRRARRRAPGRPAGRGCRGSRAASAGGGLFERRQAEAWVAHGRESSVRSARRHPSPLRCRAVADPPRTRPDRRTSRGAPPRTTALGSLPRAHRRRPRPAPATPPPHPASRR